jgi:hypothetical protein
MSHLSWGRRGLGYVMGAGLLLQVVTHAAPLAAQETDPQEEKRQAGFGVPTDVVGAMDRLFKNTMARNKLFNDYYQIFKAVITTDPFALVDAVSAALMPGGTHADISNAKALDEILTELRQARIDQYEGTSQSLINRFQQMLDNPHNWVAQGSLPIYLADGNDLHSDIQTLFERADPDQASMIYHLATTYHAATTSLAAGFTLAGYMPASFENLYGASIKTNSDLVSGTSDQPDARYNGYLYNYVVADLDWSARPYTRPGTNHIYCIQPPDEPPGMNLGTQACHPTEQWCTGGTLEPLGDGYDSSDVWAVCRSDILLEAHARYDSDPRVGAIRQVTQDLMLSLF